MEKASKELDAAGADLVKKANSAARNKRILDDFLKRQRHITREQQECVDALLAEAKEWARLQAAELKAAGSAVEAAKTAKGKAEKATKDIDKIKYYTDAKTQFQIATLHTKNAIDYVNRMIDAWSKVYACFVDVAEPEPEPGPQTPPGSGDPGDPSGSVGLVAVVGSAAVVGAGV